jgi:hypothetical protein
MRGQRGPGTGPFYYSALSLAQGPTPKAPPQAGMVLLEETFLSPGGMRARYNACTAGSAVHEDLLEHYLLEASRLACSMRAAAPAPAAGTGSDSSHAIDNARCLITACLTSAAQRVVGASSRRDWLGCCNAPRSDLTLFQALWPYSGRWVIRPMDPRALPVPKSSR